jgi:hypothetical protein
MADEEERERESAPAGTGARWTVWRRRLDRWSKAVLGSRARAVSLFLERASPAEGGVVAGEKCGWGIRSHGTHRGGEVAAAFDTYWRVRAIGAGCGLGVG